MNKNLIFILLLIPLLTGCTSINTDLVINKNKSANVQIKLLYDGNLGDKTNIQAKAIDNNYTKFLDDDYKIEKDFSANKSTIIAKKEVKNISKKGIDLSSLGFKSNLNDGKYISVKKNFFVTLYDINMTFDIPELLEEIKKSETNNNSKVVMDPEYLKKYGKENDITVSSENDDFIQNIDISTILLAQQDIQKEEEIKEQAKELFNIDDLINNFRIKLPSFASFNNADMSDGTTYIWHLRKDMPTTIKLQYIVYSSFSITLMFLAGILLLFYTAKRILKHDSQKRVGK